MLAVICSTILFTCLIYFPFKKSWTKVYPKWEALISKKKYMSFTSKSDFKDAKLKYFEVPYFHNVELTYKATKDFADKLKFIEIHEYPFYTFRKNKKVINEFIWYARFYYKDKPCSGTLEVKFR
jgi:hypothetical protein